MPRSTGPAMGAILFAMVGMADKESRSAIDLLEQDDLRQRMGQRHGGQPEHQVRVALGCGGQAVGATDDESCGPGQQLRELRRAALAPALVPRDEARTPLDGRAQAALVLPRDAL